MPACHKRFAGMCASRAAYNCIICHRKLWHRQKEEDAQSTTRLSGVSSNFSGDLFAFWAKLTQHLTWTCHWIIALCRTRTRERWLPSPFQHGKLSELRNLLRVHVKQAFVYTHTHTHSHLHFPSSFRYAYIR